MTTAKKSARHVKVRKSPSFLSTCRRIVVKTLTGGFAGVTISFAAVGALLIGVGWLLTISLEARAEIQSVVVEGSRPSRLVRAGLLAEGMPSLPALAAGLSPFPTEFPAENPASSVVEKRAPASVVALAFAAIDSPGISDRPSVVRVATTPVSFVAKTPARAVAKAVATPDVVSTGSIYKTASADAAPTPPAPRIRLAGLPPVQEIEKKPERDRRTAIYDITARTVYLPNGERLEAHSGYGRYMDDPRYVKLKNRGPTPPNVYKLTLRESLFHGVQALRMIPEDEDAMYGRDGILTHSYLLGSSGQSHGCVSFKDYPRFIRAFLRGEFDRIEVVARLDKPPVFATTPDIRKNTSAL